MDEYNFTFNDLMHELDIQDPAELGRLIKSNKLPEVSQHKPIHRRIANLIVQKLRGKEINWYKYKTRKRDKVRSGPLLEKTDITDVSIIELWFKAISHGQRIEKLGLNRVLGLVCRGGFLEGEESQEFILPLDSDINVIIGDRGAGKSTILKLLGLLTDTISEETDALITRLLDVLSEEKSNSDRITTLSRRAYKILNHYGIDLCAIFFIQAKKISCLFISLETNMYNLYEFRKGKWQQSKIGDRIGPSIMILQQGEVIRIAEERDKFYLNNIVDALFPDLYHFRGNFVQEVRNIITQLNHTRFEKAGFNPGDAYSFISQRKIELQQIIRGIDQGFFDERNLQILRDYLSYHYSFAEKFSPKNPSAWKYTPIYQLLRNPDAFYTLYIGRIDGFLEDKLSNIQFLEIQKQMRPNNLSNKSTKGEIDIDTPDNISDELITLDEIIKLEESYSEASRDNESLDEEFSASESGEGFENNIEDDEFAEQKKERELFLQAIKDLEKETNRSYTDNFSPVSPEIVEVVKEIADFLNTRLRVLSSWVFIYSSRRIRYNAPIEGLFTSYMDLLIRRSSLINFQQRKCHDIAETLNKNDLPVNIYTINATETKTALSNEIRRIVKLENQFNNLMGATPKTKLGEINFYARSYDATTSHAIQFLRWISRKFRDPQHDFIFNPIEIELLQGSIYRTFEQLSFGQKSGIILEMVLLKTKRRLVVIDQPEDNLDTNSIVNMVAPTLNRLGKDRQVIIATHNSNLVMGLNTGSLVVLESLGESGRIKVQGPPSQRKVIREMMEVLEGGESTFEKKLKMYEDFISRVRGQIQDMDITWIESSFRRRTIDRFRNFLQPVISDRSLLDFVRHELKQSDYNTLRREVDILKQHIETPKKVEESNHIQQLITQLDKLATHLDNHISALQDSIEEIRLMDTEARPKHVDLHKILIGIKNANLTRKGSIRDIQITIDESIGEYTVYVDEDHLRLVFNNLFNNALRATETRAADALDIGGLIAEVIQVHLNDVTDDYVILKFQDNGCGMPIEIMRKLYIERCSTQKGRDDGLGGVIIRKLLDLNYGKISILESRQDSEKPGTIQLITLPRRIL